jgi:hypothetical protein
LNCCKKIDKKHTVIPDSRFCLGLNLFERRRLDEKVGSFIYLGFAYVGVVFLFDGVKF